MIKKAIVTRISKQEVHVDLGAGVTAEDALELLRAEIHGREESQRFEDDLPITDSWSVNWIPDSGIPRNPKGLPPEAEIARMTDNAFNEEGEMKALWASATNALLCAYPEAMTASRTFAGAAVACAIIHKEGIEPGQVLAFALLELIKAIEERQ